MTLPIRLLAGVFVLALLGGGALAQSGAAKGKKKPDEVKRSSIQEVYGYAHLGGNMTLDMARDAAYLNARQKAVKNALSYVQAMTAMKDYQITDALVKSYSQGNVRVLKDKDLDLQPGKRYKVWIRAEVWIDKLMNRRTLEKELRGVLVVKKKPVDKQVRNDQGKDKNTATNNAGNKTKTKPKKLLTVEIWTSKRTFKNGELMKIYILGNRDFYGKVMYEDAAGNIVRLLPNKYRRNNFFKGGREYVIPGKGNRFQLTVQPPFGNERISIYASTRPTGNVSGRQLDNGMVLVKERDRNKLALQLRGVDVTSTSVGATKKLGPVEFYEAIYRVRTRR